MSETAPYYEQLARERNKKKLTIQELAQTSGVSGGYLCELERGKVSQPSDEIVERVAKALELDPAGLLHDLHLRNLPRDVRVKMDDLRKLVDQLQSEKKILNERLQDAAKILEKSKERGKGNLLEEALKKLQGEVEIPTKGRGRPTKEKSRELKQMLAKISKSDALEFEGRVQSVPIISRTPAGDPANFTDGDFPAGFAETYENVPHTGDPNAFGLRIVGDSMAPRFQSGDIVIVCPNRPVQEGKPVVAKVRGSAVTCKLYKRKGPLVILAPCNPSYDLQIYEESEINWIYRVVKIIRVED